MLFLNRGGGTAPTESLDHKKPPCSSMKQGGLVWLAGYPCLGGVGLEIKLAAQFEEIRMGAVE